MKIGLLVKDLSEVLIFLLASFSYIKTHASWLFAVRSDIFDTNHYEGHMCCVVTRLDSFALVGNNSQKSWYCSSKMISTSSISDVTSFTLVTLDIQNMFSLSFPHWKTATAKWKKHLEVLGRQYDCVPPFSFYTYIITYYL